MRNVMLKIGDTVTLKSNPSKIGTIHGEPKSRLNRIIWPVKFHNGLLYCCYSMILFKI